MTTYFYWCHVHQQVETSTCRTLGPFPTKNLAEAAGANKEGGPIHLSANERITLEWLVWAGGKVEDLAGQIRFRISNETGIPFKKVGPVIHLLAAKNVVTHRSLRGRGTTLLSLVRSLAIVERYLGGPVSPDRFQTHPYPPLRLSSMEKKILGWLVEHNGAPRDPQRNIARTMAVDLGVPQRKLHYPLTRLRHKAIIGVDNRKGTASIRLLMPLDAVRHYIGAE